MELGTEKARIFELKDRQFSAQLSSPHHGLSYDLNLIVMGHATQQAQEAQAMSKGTDEPQRGGQGVNQRSEHNTNTSHHTRDSFTVHPSLIPCERLLLKATVLSNKRQHTQRHRPPEWMDGMEQTICLQQLRNKPKNLLRDEEEKGKRAVKVGSH